MAASNISATLQKLRRYEEALYWSAKAVSLTEEYLGPYKHTIHQADYKALLYTAALYYFGKERAKGYRDAAIHAMRASHLGNMPFPPEVQRFEQKLVEADNKYDLQFSGNEKL